MLQGRVAVDDAHPAIKDWPPYLEKYGAAVERAFGSVAKFSDSYPIALRVTITSARFLPARLTTCDWSTSPSMTCFASLSPVPGFCSR